MSVIILSCINLSSWKKNQTSIRLRNRRNPRYAKGTKAPTAVIEALAVSAVRDLGRKPVVVIDLVLNWSESGDAPLRCIRLTPRRGNPGPVAPFA